ncbi:cytochrome c [Paenalcaligenes niemegkensis]|nr:cytochrome c [Paenalcaligenes niemegkensis]
MFVKNTLRLLSAAFVVAAAGSVHAADQAVLDEGKTLFNTDAKPMACALCHTLQDAGATGGIGPDLDELKPTREQVQKVMIEGMGAMPSFAATLDEDARNAIADYVVSAVN